MVARTRLNVTSYVHCLSCCRARSEPGGTRWRTGGEVKGKLANGVGSQYSQATSERGISSITKADVHTSAVSCRLDWRPHWFEWTRPFRGKTKSGFCACAITFHTSYTQWAYSLHLHGDNDYAKWPKCFFKRKLLLYLILRNIPMPSFKLQSKVV